MSLDYQICYKYDYSGVARVGVNSLNNLGNILNPVETDIF